MRRPSGCAPGMCRCRIAPYSRRRRYRRSRTWSRRRARWSRTSGRRGCAMATPVTMPMLGLTMEEGTVAEWLKAEGDTVTKDEALLTVEMDKGTVEVPAPASGVLQRIIVQPGTTVAVKTLIAEIGAEDEVLTPIASASAAPAGGHGDLPPAGAAPGDAARA